MKAKSLYLLFFVFLSLNCQAKLIEADNLHYRYTGRIDFTDPKSPYLTWSGSSVKAKFSGSSLTLRLRDDYGKNYFNVIIDKGLPFVIQAEKGEHDYWISETLGKGVHTVEIYKRTEGEEGGTHFLGLLVNDDSDLIEMAARPIRRIEIYGDSISSGMGSDAPYNAVDNLSRDKNHYITYGAIAARQLDAELHTISQSGIGLQVSWFDFTMPDFYDQLSAVGDNDTTWDFSSWTPDVVVVNLFQNDSWIVADKDKFPEPPSDKQIISAYKSFIATLRHHYPEAQIICALGSMDATKPGSQWPDYVSRAVNELKSSGDMKVSTLVFPFNGYDRHPRANQHADNAAILAERVKSITGWN